MQGAGLSKDQAKDYYKHLKLGIYAGSDIHYLFNERMGVGLKYLFFSSSADADLNLNTGDGLNFVYMRENEKMYVNYIGPSFLSTLWLGEAHKFKFTQELSLGYAHYRDELRFDQRQYTLSKNMLATGNTVGGNVEVALEYYPLQWLSVGVNTGLFSAVFKKMKISDNNSNMTVDLDKDNYENASRIHGAIAVQFHF
jgi:hypothetical protein